MNEGEKKTSLLSFSSGEMNYHLVSRSKSPFSLRGSQALVPQPSAPGASLQEREIQYQVVYQNLDAAYQVRNLAYNSWQPNPLPALLAKAKAQNAAADQSDQDQKMQEGGLRGLFFTDDQAIANQQLLHYNMKHWFLAVFQRIQKNHAALWEIDQEIGELCEAFNYPLPRLKSFDQVNNLEELLDLLHSISTKETTAFQFEFFCAALRQYVARL